ncbi:MAG: nucleotide-binding protein [Candidatus Delongbacteria bacterium]|nr:nucleotide-binding protein [Candidatus Delongbacteria bacterium]
MRDADEFVKAYKAGLKNNIFRIWIHLERDDYDVELSNGIQVAESISAAFPYLKMFLLTRKNNHEPSVRGYKVYNTSRNNGKYWNEYDFSKIPVNYPHNIQIGESDSVTNKGRSNKVFIVHGHDNEMKLEVSNFIHRIGLEPIILHELANKGQTIIEKILSNSDVGYGIVLYSPCDEGRKKNSKDKLRERARQNVVFEHGFLISRIGRKNVSAIVKGDLEKPNDISGIVYIQMDGNWKDDLRTELKELGYVLK